MLRSLKELDGYTVRATDGDVGPVVDLLLDDVRWTIRYLVVETGGFFNERRILISPISFREVDWTSQRFHVALSMDKVKKSPSVDLDKPVSRQHELDYYRYYDYPNYWAYSGLWGVAAYPGPIASAAFSELPAGKNDRPGDSHLRSAREVRGYHIQGSDDAVGHLEDFIVDDESWEIRYLTIDTSNWWFGKKVLIAPHWASQVSWQEGKVHVDMTRDAIKESPEWNPSAPVNREYEARLYDYYGRPVYWDDPRRAPSKDSDREAARPR